MRHTPIIYPYHIAMPHNLCEILDTIQSHGYRAYIIGGCVRDSLLGITPKDWDIATDAYPSAICEIFAHDMRYSLIHTGSKYGTIGVCIDKLCYEVTTFRRDGVYNDTRHPHRVQFVADLAQDVARRDFSINALAYSQQEGVVDYVDGMRDLHRKHIVCVGEPRARFGEDALRILRAIRFRASLGFEIDSRTRDTLLELCHLITTLPIERVRLELDAILLGKYAGQVLREFAEVFARLFAWRERAYASLIPILCERAQHIDMLDSHLHIRYAWILSGFDEERRHTIIEYLHFSNAHKRQLLSLLSLLSYALPRDDTEILTLLSSFGAQCVGDVLGIWEAQYGDLGALPQRVRYLIHNACYELKDLRIDGTMIKTLYHQSYGTECDGKLVGVILRELLGSVIAQELPNTRAALINQAQKLFTQHHKVRE